MEAEPSGKTTTLRSLGFCVLKNMENYNLPPHLGVHGEEIFWPNPSWWVKKIQPNLTYHISPTQSNSTHMDWVGSGWTHEFDKKKFIIIKLSRKKNNILKKPKD